ncbi:MAG: biotin/lipoyl-binding protein [Anaerolineales bacterium]|nr:biotin/lipoyl-binding protein [Anaerolineales bacterium]
MKYTAIINDKTYDIEVGANNTVMVNGEPHNVDFRTIDGSALYSLLLDNASWEALVDRNGDEYRVLIGGELNVVVVQDERTRKMAKAEGAQAAPTGEAIIKAPMPGLVRGVVVNVGDNVAAKQGVVILEAMKMENELRTPRAGIVKEVRVKAGDKVEQGQVLMIVK